MSLSRILFCGITVVCLNGAVLSVAEAGPGNVTVATPAVYVPSLSTASGPLPDGILAWDATTKETNVSSDTAQAHFVFNFTNIATRVNLGLATNITSVTNVTTVTNSSFWTRLFRGKITRVARVGGSTNVITVTNSIAPVPVVILRVSPSCGCTTTKLPPLPWTLAPRTNGQMEATVNLAGKSGTLYKTLMVYTDKGSKMLSLKITMLPFVMPVLSDADRAQNVKMAAADRQMVFKGDCAECHVKRGEGKYGQELYEADCAICHEGEHRATMVPDLHALKTPTNYEFWRIWITQGKPGSLMPAFSTGNGGPLSDMQIGSIVSYLNESIKSH